MKLVLCYIAKWGVLWGSRTRLKSFRKVDWTLSLRPFVMSIIQSKHRWGLYTAMFLIDLFVLVLWCVCCLLSVSTVIDENLKVLKHFNNVVFSWHSVVREIKLSLGCWRTILWTKLYNKKLKTIEINLRSTKDMFRNCQLRGQKISL